MKTMELERRLRRHADVLKDSMAAPFHIEMEELILKKENKRTANYRKTIAIIAVAACFLLGSTAFACGIQGGWFSAAEKEYSSMPSEQQLVSDVGYAPVLIQSFENGFSYTTGYVIDNELVDEETGEAERFKSAMFEYGRDGELVYFWQEKYESDINMNGDVVSIVDGVKLYYSSYMNKIVPEDYQMSEADKEAEAKGELVFTWGSDSVQTIEQKTLSWMEDGIHYMLLQSGGSLNADDMKAMAKEAVTK